ncbi:hypothetical protein A9K55_002022 [Cordyceps militaris]|uniref:Uncharacterized protein n=1 Tax=Cordyceps militaris TaxID=73501 RepID=A0A2H4SRL8_CORMI|nr:hypothetical protein A9K55_002022 [Cordyceps militaris]
MPSSSMYSSLDAAQDVARGACIVAWPADEPYTEPTSIVIATTYQSSMSCPSLASCTSISQDSCSDSSLSLSTTSAQSNYLP